MKRKKKIFCRAFRRKKNILPTRLLEKKKLADQKSSPPPQELNGRPLMFVLLALFRIFFVNYPDTDGVVNKPSCRLELKIKKFSFSPNGP